MPGYLDDLLRMLDQAQAPQGVTRAMAPPGMTGMDMEGEALRQAMAPPSRPQPTMDELLAALGSQQAPVSALPQADYIISNRLNPYTKDGGQFENPRVGHVYAPVSAEDSEAELRRMVEMSMQLSPFYDAAPYKQVLGPNASPTTGVPVPVTRDNPLAYGDNMPDGGQFEEPFRVIPDFTFPKDPRYPQVLAPYPSQPPMRPVPVTRDSPMAYGNNMPMPAQEMEPSNMDIRSLLAALAGAGGGFAAGRMTAPQHTMPDGTVMPGSEEEMYRAAAASMPQEPEDLTNGGQRVPGSMRMPMPPPYKTPPQLQRLNNLRMP